MAEMLNAVGRVFGRLTVIEEVKVAGKLLRRCLCVCGNEVTVDIRNLTSGNTRSCGCLYKETRRTTRRVHGLANKVPEYRVWLNLRDRCNNPNNIRYHRYGGRGIKVCSAWDSFAKFYADMGHRPKSHYRLDRVNNDGDYTPGNCRWVTNKVNCRNKSNNKILAYQGIARTVVEWAEFLGLNKSTMSDRLSYGWPEDKVFRSRRLHVGVAPVMVTDAELEEFRNRGLDEWVRSDMLRKQCLWNYWKHKNIMPDSGRRG